MTTRTDTLPPLVLSPATGFPWRRLAFSFLLAVIAVALFAFTFGYGYMRAHEGRVLPGVTIGGVSLAGLDRAQAETRLRESLPSLSSGGLAVRFAGEVGTVTYADIGRDYDMPLMLDQAFALGRDGSLVDQLVGHLRVLAYGVSVEPSMTYDTQELGRRVIELGMPAQIAPIDATIVQQQGRFVVEPSALGQSVDIERGVELAAAAITNLLPVDTSIAVEGVPVPPAVSTEVAQAAADRANSIAATSLAITGGGGSVTLEPDMIRGWVRLEETAPGSWELILERQPVAQFVSHYGEEVFVAATDASFAFRGGDIVAVRGENGQELDAEVATSQVYDALVARANGGGPSSVSMPMLVVGPTFTYEQAQELAPRVRRLSRWQTNYVPGVLNAGGRNIRVPTNIIDGTVVAAGKTFDFWRVVGMPTVEDGYGYGGAIIKGRTVPDETLAGGICSCSTTIFNAALRAGLDMGARKNHYYYISRYPVGLDATVWISDGGARQTMRFTNDMEYPILIRGINRSGAVIFEVWGIDDGRTVSFSRPRIANRRPAYTVERFSDRLAPGARRQVEWPASGFDAWVTRTVRDANGRVIHKDTFFSHYARVLGVVLVGR